MPTAKPEVRLADISLTPIMTALGLGRLPASTLPALLDEALADPDPANMYMRMYHLLEMLGQREFAFQMQARALERGRLYRTVAPPAPALRLLALMGPGDATDNAPLDFVVEGSDIRLDLLYLSPDGPFPEAIPDHDVAIIAIRDSDKSRALLARMEELVAAWPRPVLNTPSGIRHCVRERAFELLADIPGVLVPETRRLPRQALGDLRLPATIRPVDTHYGQGLARLDTAADVATYLESRMEPEFHVADYVDYRGEDGLYRKARITLIDRLPFACHLAIADHWMVHYTSAGMDFSAEKRAEEAAWMENFQQDFGWRHRAALAAIAERLELDYVVLDCAEMPDGRLLLFEVDSCAWIHATDPADIFPYKRKVMRRAFNAFRDMLLNRVAMSASAQNR